MFTAALDALYAINLSPAGFFCGLVMPSLLKDTEAKMLDTWRMVLLCFFFSKGTKALVVMKTPTTLTLSMFSYVAELLQQHAIGVMDEDRTRLRDRYSMKCKGVWSTVN